MEHMEVTLVPVDNDNNENMNVVDSNNPVNVSSHLFSLCPNAITLQLEDKKSSTSLNDEPTLGPNICDDSSVLENNEGLTEIFKNLSLNNAISTCQSTQENDHDAQSSAKASENDGTYKSDLLVGNEACPMKRICELASEFNTERCNKKISDVCDKDPNSSNLVIVHSDSSAISRGHAINVQPCKDDTTIVTCEEQASGTDKDETEHCTSSSVVRKECDMNSKLLQYENGQKQTSEIKERVMGFLTKYANIDEASCNSPLSTQIPSKQECVKERKSHIVNESNNTSEVVNEQCKGPNLQKSSDSVIPKNSAESAPANSKLNFVSISKDLVTSGGSQTWSFGFSAANQLISSIHPADQNNQQPTTCTTFVPLISSQNKFLFRVSNNEPLSRTLISSGCKNECNKPSDVSLEGSIPVSKINVCTFQSEKEIMFNNLGLEMPQNCQQFNLYQNSQVPSDYSNSGTCAKEMRQQDEFNTNLSSLNSMFHSSNNFFGNRLCSSSQKNATLNLNTLCINQSTHSLQRNNTNTAPVDSRLSFERMSCQPHTTPSINSPILSSKSSDHSSSKYSLLSENMPVSKLWTDNGKSSVWPSYNASKSRRTTCSEAVFCSPPNPLSSGNTVFCNNSNSKSQIFDNSCFGNAGEMSGTNLSDFHTVQCDKYLNMSSLPDNAMNRNPHGKFLDTLGKLFYCANKETLQSGSKCFGSTCANNPFKKNADNPFTKMSDVESIGLFNCPVKSAASEIENSVFKPVSSSLFSLKSENAEEFTGGQCKTDKSSMLKPNASKDHTQFVFRSGFKNKQEHMAHTFTEFTFGRPFTHETVTNASPVFTGGQMSSEVNNRVTPFFTSEGVSRQTNSNTSCQFTFSPEKSKTYSGSRVTWSRSTRKGIKIMKQHEKVPLKSVKNISPYNVVGKDTEDLPFKPVYGSDVKSVNGINKNVIVRYQNIVFMKEYLCVSPEELRSQFYAKTVVSEPFKFSACTESDSHKNHSHSKTQNQEIQTEEHMTSQKPDLAGIWRVLECPVCLDVVLPPVYQCEQGHHACSICWVRISTCPLCKRPQSGTRNYMAEALVEQVPLPCRYHIEGCKETVQHNRKISHEEACSYRMYQCPVPSCNQAHSYQNMCKHFKKLHQDVLHHEGHSVGKGEKFCDVLYKEALLSSFLHAFDITKWGLFFLREVTVGPSTAFFVQVMPAAADQAVYFYHLEVCDHHDCRKECYKGRVFPMSKPTQEIIDQEEYLCVSKLILKTVKKTTPLKIVVSIWQLKPAFTLSTE